MKYKPYEVMWSVDNGNDIDYREFYTLKEARAYLKKHMNDKGKEDMHINKWKMTVDGYGNPQWELVDSDL